MRKRIVFTAVNLVLLVFVFGVSRQPAQSEPSLESTILSKVASQQDLSESQLTIAALERANFPLTDVTLYESKVVDLLTGQSYGLVVDAAGQERDLLAAQAAESVAHNAQYGSIDPALYDQLMQMASSEQMTIAIWLKAENINTLERPDSQLEQAGDESGQVPLPPPVLDNTDPPRVVEEAETESAGAESEQVAAAKASQLEQQAILNVAQAANADLVGEQLAAVQALFITDLAGMGFTPSYVSISAPLIYVEMPVADILNLARRDDVVAIYGPQENYDVMSSAKPTHKADIVDTWFGYDGNGIDVAILEDSRVEFNNPFLNNGTTRLPADANVDDHATATAGMVASQHSTQQGIAQGVNLFSANATTYNDADISAAMDWAAITQNMDVINNSWGGNDGNTNLNQHDRHLDYIVRNLWSTVTVAAGNEGNASGRVGSPARAYNVISVGNFNDQNSSDWTSDSMNSSSSYIDPSTGVEKPEVAASGTSINSTTMSSPWIGNVGSGTSYSAPMVAGEAAILMERNSSLAIRPEAVKAIIMATALNNIEGSSRLSEYDGAGGVDMRAAFRVADEGWWNWRSVSSASFPYSLYAYAYAGETVRAVIAWDSNPNAAYTSDPLDADIDLYVYAPDGSYVTGSFSGGNSYEIVEFVAPQTGSYELRVNDFAFNGTTEYIGAAWWTGHRRLSSYTSQTLGTPPIGRDYFQFSAATDWNVVGIRSPGAANYNIYLYEGSAFADPGEYNWLEDSTLTSAIVDYVVVDRNHAPSGSYYPEVRTVSGSGSYPTQWATRSTFAYSGTYGPYTMSTSQVVRVWDVDMTGGVRKYFAVKPVSGDANLGMALHDTNPSDSTSWYQGRSQAVVSANVAGSGGDEFMNYQTSTTDWLGLVVWNDGSTTSTSYYLYADTTAPTGSISINSGDGATNSTAVNLSPAASDPHTGVTEMRFSNNGSTWSSWESYSTSKSWAVSSGDGLKTVYVQFRNNANMVSTSFTDTIVLDTTAPTAVTASSPASTSNLSFLVSWSGSDSGSGIASYDVQYKVGASGTWSSWLTGTSVTTAVFGPAAPAGVVRDETYYFRVRVRDVAGNVTTYPGGDGHTQTYVDYINLYLPMILR